jgi:hypothetical protein
VEVDRSPFGAQLLLQSGEDRANAEVEGGIGFLGREFAIAVGEFAQQVAVGVAEECAKGALRAGFGEASSRRTPSGAWARSKRAAAVSGLSASRGKMKPPRTQGMPAPGMTGD